MPSASTDRKSTTSGSHREGSRKRKWTGFYCRLFLVPVKEAWKPTLDLCVLNNFLESWTAVLAEPSAFASSTGLHGDLGSKGCLSTHPCFQGEQVVPQIWRGVFTLPVHLLSLWLTCCMLLRCLAPVIACFAGQKAFTSHQLPNPTYFLGGDSSGSTNQLTIFQSPSISNSEDWFCF